jgi:hypothetical protein
MSNLFAQAELVSVLASRLAEAQPPSAMNNEAKLSTAVVAANGLDGHKGFLQDEIGVLGAAVVPPVLSSPAFDVLIFDDERRVAQSAVLRSTVDQISVDHQIPPWPGKKQVSTLL